MSSNWNESETGSVGLPDDDPDTFQVYLYWLYYKKLPVKSENPCYSEYLQLAKAVVLGDKLRDPDFENSAIDAIIDKSRFDTINAQTLGPMVVFIYKHSLEGCKARKLLVDLHLSDRTKGWLDGYKGLDLPSEFFLELATTLLRRRPKTDDYITDPRKSTYSCRYHNHPSGKNSCDKSNEKLPRQSRACPTRIRNNIALSN